MKIRLLVLFSLIILFTGSAVLWFREATSPVSRKEQYKDFVIEKGESSRSIAKRLEQEGLIRSSLAFFLLTRITGVAENIQAGHFRLSPSMEANSIALALTHGTADIWVTTLEGWRKEEIALELAQKLSIPEQEFLRFAKEGYMFPDTYLIPKQASASSIASMFIENFDRRIGEELKTAAAQKGLTLNQVITLASLVERETKHDEDRPIIAGILIKRWKNDWPLQADASVQYALGYQPDEKRWWKRHLTEDDLRVDSPYNTYINLGLPPGPIANPSLASIKAVIFPKETDNWYYISDREGRMHYARSFEEHQENIAKYLR